MTSKLNSANTQIFHFLDNSLSRLAKNIIGCQQIKLVLFWLRTYLVLILFSIWLRAKRKKITLSKSNPSGDRLLYFPPTVRRQWCSSGIHLRRCSKGKSSKKDLSMRVVCCFGDGFQHVFLIYAFRFFCRKSFVVVII